MGRLTTPSSRSPRDLERGHRGDGGRARPGELPRGPGRSPKRRARVRGLVAAAVRAARAGCRHDARQRCAAAELCQGRPGIAAWSASSPTSRGTPGPCTRGGRAWTSRRATAIEEHHLPVRAGGALPGERRRCGAVDGRQGGYARRGVRAGPGADRAAAIPTGCGGAAAGLVAVALDRGLAGSAWRRAASASGAVPFVLDRVETALTRARA